VNSISIIAQKVEQILLRSFEREAWNPFDGGYGPPEKYAMTNSNTGKELGQEGSLREGLAAAIYS
jgi:hypothetical protein